MRKLGKGMGALAALAVAGTVALGAAGLALAQEPDALTALTALTSRAVTTAPASSPAASSDAAATTDGAPDTPTSPAVVKSVTVSLTDADDALVVPYGVDPVAWLNEHLTFDVTVTKTDGTTQTEKDKTAADLASYVEGGKMVVAATPAEGQEVPYPVNTADDQGNLTKAPD